MQNNNLVMKYLCKSFSAFIEIYENRFFECKKKIYLSRSIKWELTFMLFFLRCVSIKWCSSYLNLTQYCVRIAYVSCCLDANSQRHSLKLWAWDKKRTHRAPFITRGFYILNPPFEVHIRLSKVFFLTVLALCTVVCI